MEEKILNILLEMQKNSLVEMQEIRSEIREMRTEFKTDMANMKTDMASMKTDMASMKTDIETLKSDINELKAQRYIDSHNIAKILEHQVELIGLQ